MSRIKGRDTKLEIAIRKALFARGFRYRINYRKLPGKPDIALPKYKAAVFVHGCFWHGHDCHLFRLPSSNRGFWRSKIKSNRDRDQAVIKELQRMGWKVAVVWECSVRGKSEEAIQGVADRLTKWIRSSRGASFLEIRG